MHSPTLNPAKVRWTEVISKHGHLSLVSNSNGVAIHLTKQVAIQAALKTLALFQRNANQEIKADVIPVIVKDSNIHFVDESALHNGEVKVLKTMELSSCYV